MRSRSLRFATLALIVNSLCGQEVRLPPGAQEAMARITAVSLRESLTFLASDELEGRDTPSPGLDRAAGWLAAHFQAAGLTPAFAGSFFQGPHQADRDRARGELVWGGQSRALGPAEILAGSSEAVDIKQAPLFLAAAPWRRGEATPPDLTPGSALLLRLPDVVDARWWRRQAVWINGLRDLGTPALILVGSPLPPRVPSSPPLPILHLPLKDGLGPLPSEPGPVPQGSLTLEIPLSDAFWARNVGALLPGADPDFTKEVIVFSAHYDHVGRGTPIEGDAIYNGADDDATGTAAVLAIAEAMARLPAPPRRTTLYLCFYGEEKGLLGSRFYCDQPARPLALTRAVFNLEMLGRPEGIDPSSAWITGWGVSDFGEIIAAAGLAVGVRFFEHQRYSPMLFTASDNLSFARRGVPAHSFSAGSLHADYHRPSDEVEKLDFKNMAAVVRGIFAAGVVMADGGRVPAWKEGTSYARAWTRLQEEAGGK